MRRRAVGHRQWLKVETVGFCLLSQKLPIVTAVIQRLCHVLADSRIELVRAVQAAESLLCQQQTRAQLQHLVRRERGRKFEQRDRRVIIRNSCSLRLSAQRQELTLRVYVLLEVLIGTEDGQ